MTSLSLRNPIAILMLCIGVCVFAVVVTPRDALAMAKSSVQAQIARLDEARADLDGLRDVRDAIDKAARR